ncbi:MAG: hypothetical protein IJE89_03600 [Bacilli bacterium]|nr:hypothetical protein [Bacilli bacterium]
MENMINELEKKYSKFRLISYISLFAVMLFGATGTFITITFVSELIQASINNNIVKNTIGFIICNLALIFSAIIMNKSLRKEAKILEEIKTLEKNTEKDKTIADIKTKFELLSKDSQLKLLNFIKDDVKIQNIASQILSLDTVRQEIMESELEYAYNGYGKLPVDYVVNYVNDYIFRNYGKVSNQILEDLKKDKTKFQTILPGIDWKRVDIDAVYQKMFGNENIRQDAFTRRRTDNRNCGQKTRNKC